MLIGGVFFSEQDQIRIPVTLSYVTQDLIVGPVLLDDVKDVFDGR